MGWAERANRNNRENKKRNKGGFMGTAEKAAVKRLGRGIFGLIISAFIAWFTKEPKAIVAMPIINAAGKYLRGKFNIPNVPF